MESKTMDDEEVLGLVDFLSLDRTAVKGAVF